MAISSEMVLPVPPTMPKVGTKMLLMICGSAGQIGKGQHVLVVLINRTAPAPRR